MRIPKSHSEKRTERSRAMLKVSCALPHPTGPLGYDLLLTPRDWKLPTQHFVLHSPKPLSHSGFRMPLFLGFGVCNSFTYDSHTTHIQRLAITSLTTMCEAKGFCVSRRICSLSCWTTPPIHQRHECLALHTLTQGFWPRLEIKVQATNLRVDVVRV